MTNQPESTPSSNPQNYLGIPWLDMLSWLAEKEIEMPVSLMVGGFIVSGLVITAKQFDDGILEAIRTALVRGNISQIEEMRNGFLRGFNQDRQKGADRASENTTTKGVEERFLYLKNATILTSVVPLKLIRVPWWKVDSDAVSGYTLGDLIIP